MAPIMKVMKSITKKAMKTETKTTRLKEVLKKTSAKGGGNADEVGVMGKEKQAEIRAKKRAMELEVSKPDGTCALEPHVVELWKKAQQMGAGRAAKLRDIAMNACEK